MKDERRHKKSLLDELSVLRKRNAELEQLVGATDEIGGISPSADLVSENRSSERHSERSRGNEPTDRHVRRKGSNIPQVRDETVLRTIFRQSSQAIAVCDEKGRISDVNPAFASMFGYSRAELCNVKLLVIAHRAHIREWEKQVKGVLKGRSGSSKAEAPLIRKDGALFWGELTLAPIQGPDEQVRGAAVVIIDITDRKEAEKALRERDALVRALYDKAAHAIASTDNQGKFIEVNPAFESMFGYTREEVLQMTHLDITAPEHVPLSKDRAAALFREEIDGYRFEKLYRRKDGSVFWGDLTVRALHTPEHGVQSVAVIADISERKASEEALQAAHDELESRVERRTAELAATNEKLRVEIRERARAQDALKLSEERLRAIFETATDCVFIKDRSLKYSLINPSMKDLLGLPASEIVGASDEDLFGPGVARHMRQVDLRVLAGETIEEEHSRPIKGNVMTFLDIRAPMRDSSGNVVGICGIARNITERSRTDVASGDTGQEYPSSAMRSVLIQAETAGKTDAIILLMGESGSGKDHLARFIHNHSARAGGPFYSINCGAIPADLAESELFGHERGAFTGASRTRRGLFELAEGGTVLLNEIGELPLPLQVKLLTFLDTFSFSRLGGEKRITVDARLIAATNRNLEEEVESGRFRRDLFYRLNVVPIRVPSLRERREDVPLLAERIIDHLMKELQLPYRPELDADALTLLAKYQWPGNVRELRNVLERAIILSGHSRLTFDFLTLTHQCDGQDAWAVPFPPSPSLPEAISELNRSFVRAALQRTGGKRQEAADLLGISRFALLRHVKRMGGM